MRLRKILDQCKTEFSVENFSNMNINGISDFSKGVGENFIFAAVKGQKLNGEIFISELLILKKLVLILSKKTKININLKLNSKIVIIKTQNVRLMFSEISSIFYPNKIKEKIAVTGTNGKTSITNYVMQLWNKKNQLGSSVGTLGFIYKKKVIQGSNLTTHDTLTNHKYLNKLTKMGCKRIIFEASSIGLDQFRLYPIKFDAIAFTNLSRDHLDYHRSMKDYMDCKSLLFKNYVKNNSFSVINSDSVYSKYFLKICKKNNITVLDYGKKGSFLKIKKLDRIKEKFLVSLKLLNTSFHIEIKSTTSFEIYNKICALLLVFGEKIKIDDFKLIKKLRNPKGRMEKIYDKKDISVFIDYAHTPNALKNVLTSLREIVSGKLYLLFGCGGNRDKGKRLIMTKVALKFSDHIIITDDNPRLEDPQIIREDMTKGLKGNDLVKITKIGGRKKAIKFSIGILRQGDILLIAGKGHENYQIIGREKKKFSDKKTALQFLKKK